VQTGVTGIGALSPAISVAGATNQVFFSGFQEGRYSVYSLDGNAQIDAVPLDYVRVATLPPLQRTSTRLRKRWIGPLPDWSRLRRSR
jgi:hypothetical protein